MIGNDIVDLALTRIESNWKRDRWIEKIFTSKEQRAIFSAKNPEVMVWCLWSGKEAAYKIFHRKTKNRVFMPKDFECTFGKQQHGLIFGKVKVDQFIYLTRTIVTNELIYTEAVTERGSFQKIENIDSINTFKDQFGIPHAKLSKNPVSKTHHGAFERCVQLDIYTQSRF